MSTMRGGGADAAARDGDCADGPVSTVPVSGVRGVEPRTVGGEGEEAGVCLTEVKDGEDREASDDFCDGSCVT